MLTQEEVYEVAALARIELTEAEANRFQKELSAVLDFFSELETLDTDSLEPIGHITGRIGGAEADIVRPSDQDTKKRIQANFPEGEDGYLTVRSVF
jgi:aspartyl-tRNA(Asn)/glutamyl-tRNA(Gln) amidotransferase subunit C